VSVPHVQKVFSLQQRFAHLQRFGNVVEQRFAYVHVSDGGNVVEQRRSSIYACFLCGAESATPVLAILLDLGGGTQAAASVVAAAVACARR